MHQWTLEDEDRTCKWNAMDPREAHSSACQSAKNVRMQKCKMWKCKKCETQTVGSWNMWNMRWRRGMMDGWGLDLMCALQCSSGREIWLVPRGLLLRRDSSVGEGSCELGFGLAKGVWKCAGSHKAREKARKYREVHYSPKTRKQGFLTQG